MATPDYSALEREQVARVRAVRANRDPAAVNRALETVRAQAPAYASRATTLPPLMPFIIDAVRARATVGEIADTLREAWGEYRT